MNRMDFVECAILHFTPEEVELTGANLKDVQCETMMRLESARRVINRRIKLLHNGLTTGDHDAEWHPKGFAVDFYLDTRDGPVSVSDTVKAILAAGFRGIGAYYNGKAHSFHADLRPDYAFWVGTTRTNGKWKYGPMIVDPKDIA